MLNRYQVKTVETVSKFDEDGNFTGKSVIERTRGIVFSGDDADCGSADAEIENSAVLEATAELSLPKILLAAALGTLMGRMLYRAICRD